MKRGQISFEYLIVVSFILFIIIGLLGVALFYASGIKDRIKINQVEGFAEKIITNSESVFFAGEPSKVTITAFLPEGVEEIEIVEQELVFYVLTSSGLNKIAFSSSVPLTGNFSFNSGLKKFEVIAGNDFVQVSEV